MNIEGKIMKKSNKRRPHKDSVAEMFMIRAVSSSPQPSRINRKKNSIEDGIYALKSIVLSLNDKDNERLMETAINQHKFYMTQYQRVSAKVDLILEQQKVELEGLYINDRNAWNATFNALKVLPIFPYAKEYAEHPI
jgi:hypothetical protein